MGDAPDNMLVPTTLNNQIWERLNPVITPATSVSQNDHALHPKEFILSQNYPNPFNPTTTIEYSVPQLTERDLAKDGQIPPSPFSEKGERGGFVSLKVYDILGRGVAVLVNEEKPAGVCKATWDTKGISSGMYFYGLQAGTNLVTGRLIIPASHPG
jgi:hypothetical protein